MPKNAMVDDLKAALQKMVPTQEILQRFKKVFGSAVTLSEREDFFMPNEGASLKD